jgi:sugar phosphate isomerase/epimerase
MVLPKLAEFGYFHVHFSKFSALLPEEPRSISDSCHKYGLRPYSAHGPGAFLPDSESELESMIEKHKKNIDSAAILGVTNVTVHIASVEGIRDNETGQFSGPPRASPWHPLKIQASLDLNPGFSATGHIS